MVLKNLGVVDYVVMAAVLAISVAIGIFTACTGTKQRTTTEFLVGDRTMELLPVSLSVLATFTSAITVLAMPEEVYRYGIDWWWIIISITLVIPTVAHLYLPIFYKLQITSVYEVSPVEFMITTIYFQDYESNMLTCWHTRTSDPPPPVSKKVVRITSNYTQG